MLYFALLRFVSKREGQIQSKFDVKDVKLESSEACLLKLGKNLSWDFEVIYIFRKNAVLNIYRYLKSFYTYKKKKITFS